MKKAVISAVAAVCALSAFCGCGQASELKYSDDGGFPVRLPGDRGIIGTVSELLTVEELVEFHDSGEKYPENFVFEELRGYGRVLSSASSAEEAQGIVYNHFTNSSYTIVENAIEVETELFYGIYARWANEQASYDEYVVSFKSDVYDFENNSFGTTDKDEIKSIIDYIYYSRTYNIGGSKVYSSDISVKDCNYEYVIYLLEVCYGDWGLQDRLSFIKEQRTIDIATGETVVSDRRTVGTVSVDGALTHGGVIR